MKTTHEVLYMLNDLDFKIHLEEDSYSDFGDAKKILSKKFHSEGYRTELLRKMLCLVDDLHVTFLTQDNEPIKKTIEILRDYNFVQVKEKANEE